MLALSRGPRNWSNDPARRMVKIGIGRNLLFFDPTKSGVYSPPMPTITVQLPDGDGSIGSSNGGAGSVNAVCADADCAVAMIVPSAARQAVVHRAFTVRRRAASSKF